jgi:hypothetical protein
VRIDDFDRPRFAPDVTAMLTAMADMAPSCVLEPDPLLEAASAQSGLDDFGDAADPGFRERLEVLTRAMVGEAGLSPWGVVSMHAQLVQLLVNRLRVTDLLVRHPEIRDVRIDAPIVIAGLPRTGTTHLHNVLAADPGLRSLPYWESLEPVPPRAELEHPVDPDPRLARTQVAVDFVDAAMPYFCRMHEMTVDHVHEEIQLLAMDLSTMYFETLLLMPSWREYYRSHDQTPHYRYLRTVLQVCTWLRGGERWVLKSPQHLEQFRALRSVFPDATYVITHRDPAAVTLSLATMIAYTARMQVERPDPIAVGAYWTDRVADLLDACAADRDLLPAEQSVDVRFDDFMADDDAVLAGVYARAGRTYDAGTRAAIRAYVDTHPRGRHGSVVYDATPLGIDLDAQRARLRDYSDRFGVTASG